MSTGLKVLVADDHDVHRSLLKAIFESCGCSVTAVEDGAQALAAGRVFDLVCLDRHMPNVGGDEVAAALAETAFQVACTADAANLPPEFKLLITKPINSVAVFHAVMAAMDWKARTGPFAWSAGEAIQESHRLIRILEELADWALVARPERLN